MSLVADYGSSGDDSVATASADEGDQVEENTIKSFVYRLFIFVSLWCSE